MKLMEKLNRKTLLEKVMKTRPPATSLWQKRESILLFTGTGATVLLASHMSVEDILFTIRDLADVQQVLVDQLREQCGCCDKEGEKDKPLQRVEEEALQREPQDIVEYLRESGDCPEVLDGLADGLNKVFGKAQSVIIAYARNNANRPSEDTTIALTYAELVLQARGIGTCWSGYLQRFLHRCDKLAAMFPIPENNAFYGCMLLGYPTEEYFYIPRRLKLADIKTLK